MDTHEEQEFFEYNMTLGYFIVTVSGGPAISWTKEVKSFGLFWMSLTLVKNELSSFFLISSNLSLASSLLFFSSSAGHPAYR